MFTKRERGADTNLYLFYSYLRWLWNSRNYQYFLLYRRWWWIDEEGVRLYFNKGLVKIFRFVKLLLPAVKHGCLAGTKYKDFIIEIYVKREINTSGFTLC